MPEIRSLTRQVPVAVKVDIGGESVNLSFDRNAITPYLLSQMQTRLEDGDVMAVAEMLSRVILEWDVTEDGNPFPATAENIGKLSVNALGSLSRLIGDESVPASEEGNVSATTSSSPSADSSWTQASPPNGEQPLSSPPLSESQPTR